jgi:cytochrome c oxidase cbb3-type subunit III
MSKQIERDVVSGTETTGHEWDGIKELNTPLPRWWIYTFYATVVWALGYTVLYPAWPMATGATPGLLGYSSRADLVKTVDEAKLGQKAQLDKIAAASVDDILKDPDMLAFARAGGAAAFKVNCVQCHGAGAAGSAGYPNLNDDDWLWGGNAEQIHATLQNGVRYTLNSDTRDSQMPAFGVDGLLKPEQIADVANYVVSLSGGEGVDAAAAERGKLVYTENDTCVACHGADGKGNRDLGGPNLTDKIWLYGGTVDEVKAQVTKPRHGVMPAWSQRLDATTVKQLAVYVHTLGGGEAASQ